MEEAYAALAGPVAVRVVVVVQSLPAVVAFAGQEHRPSPLLLPPHYMSVNSFDVATLRVKSY